MLSPDQEIHSAYLRTLRQTLTDVLLPGIDSSAARNALSLCDFILVRMIAAGDELPAIRDAHGAAYRASLESAAALLDDKSGPEDMPIWTTAAELQLCIRRLFEQIAPAPEDQRRRFRVGLAEIAAADARFREDYENGAKRAASRHESPLRSLRITPEAVQSYLDERFPAQELRLKECRQIAGGRSKLTVFVALETNTHLPSQLVMRIDNPGSAQNTNVHDEFPVLEAMYRAGACAPEPLWLESDSSHFGSPFLVMRRMAGSAPGDLWSAEGVPRPVALALAGALVQVKRVDTASVWPSAPFASRDAVEQMIAAMDRKRGMENGVTSVTIEFANCWLKEHIACIEGPSVPVHGDVHFANVLADGDKFVCLTDWEFAHPGHPAEDLAFCQSYIEQIMPWSEFMAHYLAFGGAGVTEEQLRFFRVWGLLRNATFAANMVAGFTGRSIHDVQNLYIGLHSRARIEALLSATLASEMGRNTSSDA
jgi:aminoglycoside phosphotransferase (APT) family kinase protein